jgi:ligand-binding SRPBCC domain-containing protein
MAYYQIHQEQKIPATIEEVWDFISSPANLKIITPDYMGFDITTPNLPDKMYAGMVIGYKVSPVFGIKMNWLTEITQVQEKEFFIDEQRVGPYRLWHHQHMIKAIDNGVLMNDIVTYIPPGWVLGKIANSLMIKKKLKEIFDYRRKAMEDIFWKY